ncbi:MAG TPA: hypothetical protein VIP29_00730 [Nitrososphaeraceae archaeon]
MNQLYTIMMVLTIVASAGIIVNFLVESVDAWHSQFATKKECTNFMKNTFGNSISYANKLCQKIVPH